MLIKRQGENGIVNFDNVELIDTAADKGCANVFAKCASGETFVLGWYKTAERAKEVMQEIMEEIEMNTRERTYKMP